MKTVLTLASNSPRRRQLLSFGGWMFHVAPVDIDETPQPGEAPLPYVLRMARTKAAHAGQHLKPGGVAVAADTTVADGSAILGKPANAAEAVEMLTRLRGRTHQVHTAIAVIRAGEDDPLIDVCTTDVPMRRYTDAEIAEYIATGDPFDKAGGYAIQHAGFRPVEALAGCYANVVGLPLCHLARALRKLHITPQREIPAGCLHELHYDCRIYPEILGGE